MIADLFAMFTTQTPQPNATPDPGDIVEASDPQPREPIAHPLAKPRPANARPVYPHVTTYNNDEDEKPDVFNFDDLDRDERLELTKPIEPREPVAHPALKPHPTHLGRKSAR